MIKKVRIIAAIIIAAFGLVVAVSNFVLSRKNSETKAVEKIEKMIYNPSTTTPNN